MVDLRAKLQKEKDAYNKAYEEEDCEPFNVFVDFFRFFKEQEETCTCQSENVCLNVCDIVRYKACDY